MTIGTSCSLCGGDIRGTLHLWRGEPFHLECLPNESELPPITCSLCGQTMPADAEPDGCRDPDCPVAK